MGSCNKRGETAVGVYRPMTVRLSRKKNRKSLIGLKSIDNNFIDLTPGDDIDVDEQTGIH
jgi:hypothetical protein